MYKQCHNSSPFLPNCLQRICKYLSFCSFISLLWVSQVWRIWIGCKKSTLLCKSGNITQYKPNLSLFIRTSHWLPVPYLSRPIFVPVVLAPYLRSQEMMFPVSAPATLSSSCQSPSVPPLEDTTFLWAAHLSLSISECWYAGLIPIPSLISPK